MCYEQVPETEEAREVASDVPDSVLVVDDEAAVRQMLTRVLTEKGFRVESFESARDFLAYPAVNGPACLVLDLAMPGTTGLELQRQMRDRGIELPIVFLTGHGSVSACVQALKSGAVEFLEKPFKTEQLVGVIRAAIARHRDDQAARQERNEILARVRSLAPREYEVLTHVLSGLLDDQIAQKLGVSETVVHDDRDRVMQKILVDSLDDLQWLARELGLLQPSDQREQD